jgi:hypothetical protein
VGTTCFLLEKNSIYLGEDYGTIKRRTGLSDTLICTHMTQVFIIFMPSIEKTQKNYKFLENIKKQRNSKIFLKEIFSPHFFFHSKLAFSNGNFLSVLIIFFDCYFRNTRVGRSNSNQSPESSIHIFAILASWILLIHLQRSSLVLRYT